MYDRVRLLKSLVYKSGIHRWDWNTAEACIQERDTQGGHPIHKIIGTQRLWMGTCGSV